MGESPEKVQLLPNIVNWIILEIEIHGGLGGWLRFWLRGILFGLFDGNLDIKCLGFQLLGVLDGVTDVDVVK